MKFKIRDHFKRNNSSIDSYKLYLGDCAKVLRNFPDNEIDLVVTSPPYDNLRTYNGYEFDFEAIAKELFRVLKDGGVIVWIVNDATIDGSETATSFKQALYFKSIGLNLHDTMIYSKKNYKPLTHNRYEQAFEYMFVLSKSRPKTFNGIQIPSMGKTGGSFFFESDGSKRIANSAYGLKHEKLKPNVWLYGSGMNKNGHPATFPLQLALDHIQSWSNRNDIVLDPFCGSGTTGVAALELGRKFRGIEISEQYLELSKSRIEQSLQK